MQIKRRRLLVLLLVLSQSACMAFGLVWASQWLRRTFEDCAERNAAAQGRSLVSDLARRLADMPMASIEPGAPGWNQLQQLCEEIKTPNDGFVSVIRRDTGALVCHSRLESDPSLLRKFPGRVLLVTDRSVAPLVEAVAKAGDSGKLAVDGKLEVDGKLFSVTCLALPKLNAILAVHQSQASIDRDVAELLNPLAQAGIVLAASVVSVTALLTMFLVTRFESTLTTVNASLERGVERRTKSLVRTRNAVVFGLAKLAESRSKDTPQHIERIRTYVTILASEMAKHHGEIDHHYVANLAVASSLHDVGKVSVPDGVLLKRGLLTPAERRAMQLHTVLGGECLAAMQRQLGEDDFLELGRQVAVAHHEQWDGSGYPHGLQGKAIPLSARIVALADVYDALTSHRSYRAALSHAEAREWIVLHYGTHFDPAVVEAFVAREHDFVRLSQNASLAEPSDRATAHSQFGAARPAAGGETESNVDGELSPSIS